MKKIFILLALIFLVTGCSSNQVMTSSDDIDTVIDNILSSDINLENQYFSGYQFYLPREVSILDKYNYNTILLYKSNKMYLYVDVISYYHKTEEEYSIDEDVYFSKVFEYDDKTGYINIIKEDDKYYVELGYNYGIIEAYSDSEDLNGIVMNACYILKSLEFNDVVIESLIGTNQIEYQEEQFDLFKSDSSNDSYLGTATGEDSYIDSEEIITDDDSITIVDEDELSG